MQLYKAVNPQDGYFHYDIISGCLYNCNQVVYYSLNKLILILFPRCIVINTAKVDIKYLSNGGGIPYSKVTGKYVIPKKRSSYFGDFLRIDVFINFTKFREKKALTESLLLYSCSLHACNFIKEVNLAQVAS